MALGDFLLLLTNKMWCNNTSSNSFKVVFEYLQKITTHYRNKSIKNSGNDSYNFSYYLVSMCIQKVTQSIPFWSVNFFFLFPVKCTVVTTNWSSFMFVTVIKYPEKEQCSQGKGLLSSQSHWSKSELESELVSLQR